MKRTILVICYSLLAAGLLSAENGNGQIVSIEKELEFAANLVKKHPHPVSFEMADQICDRALDTKPADNIRARIEFTRVSIRREKVNMPGISPDQRSVYFDEAVKLLTQYLTAYGENIEVKFGIGELLIGKGRFLAGLLKQEENPDRKSSIKTEAEAAFKKADDYFKLLTTGYQKELDKINEQLKEEYPKENPDQSKIKELGDKASGLDSILAEAEYSYAQSRFANALLYEESNQKRKELLESSIKLFDPLIERAGPSNWAYHLINEQGLSYLESGNYDKALECFDKSTASLLGFLKQRAQELGLSQKELENMREDVREISQRGFALKGQAYNRMGNYKSAVQSVDELFKTFPDAKKRLKEEEFAQQALLEKAEALFSLKETAPAFEIIKEVISLKGRTVQSAIALRHNLIRQAGPSGISPEMFLNYLMEIRETGEFGKQSKVFLTALRKYPKEEQGKYIPEVLWLIGEGYIKKNPRQPYEALIIFEELYRNYKDNPLAANAANNAMLCCFQIAGETNDAAYKERGKQIAKLMSERGWGGDMIAANSAYAEGKYLEAAELYKKVPKDSKAYLQSQANVGLMYYSHTEKNIWTAYEKEQDTNKKSSLKEEASRYLNQAEQYYKSTFNLTRENIKSAASASDEMQKMRDFESAVLLGLAQAYRHPALQKYAEAIKTLDNYETAYANMPAKVSRALQYKTEDLINLNDLAQAESYLEMLTGITDKHKIEMSPKPILMIGTKYEDAANQIIPAEIELEGRPSKVEELKNKDKNLYNKFTQSVDKYAVYYSRWLVKSSYGKVSSDDALIIADRLLRAGADLVKQDFYQKAADVYNDILSNKYTGQIKEVGWKIRWKNAICYLKMERWDNAFRLMEDVEKEQPDNGAIKTELALSYEKAGEWNKALNKWFGLHQRLPESSKDWWNARYHIALAYYKTGNYPALRNRIDADYPNFDNNQFGFKDKFIELDKELRRIEPGK